MASTQILSIAVCLSDGTTLSDFVTPIELIASLNDKRSAAQMGEVPFTVELEFLSTEMKPIVSMIATCPTVNPTTTYKAALASGKQYDVLWVPAGPVGNLAVDKGLDLFPIPADEIEFIKKQTPGAKNVLSVCGGSVQLALAGVLEGKKATTNKAFYKLTVATFSDYNIEWVPKARWVIDGKIWTSSGVTAGIDMAVAYIEHIAGKKAATFVRNIAEVIEVQIDEDPFAVIHGLV